MDTLIRWIMTNQGNRSISIAWIGSEFHVAMRIDRGQGPEIQYEASDESLQEAIKLLASWDLV